MTGARQPTKPGFLWQAALILLPVVVLAAVGWFSLRQDKRLAEREAEDRAQAIADDFAPKVWHALTAENSNRPSRLEFQVSENGQLLFPPPCPLIPTPKPFDLATLNLEQTRLWLAVQSAETQTNAEALTQAVEDFIQTDPPENFAAAAHYNLGLWFARQKKLLGAMGRFTVVAEEYPDAVGESGLPLRQLAFLKLLELQPNERALPTSDYEPSYMVRNSVTTQFPPVELGHYVSLDNACSNFVCVPSPLSPYLLQEIEARWSPQSPTEVAVTTLNKLNHAGTPEMQEVIHKWQRVWREHELSRELFAAAREHFRTNVSITLSPMPAIKKKRDGDETVDALPDQLLSTAASMRTNIEAPPIFWFNTPTPLRTSIPGDGINVGSLEIEEQHWLAFRADTNAMVTRYLCLAESEVGLRMHALMKEAKRLPDYFGVGIELAGRRVEEFAPSLRVWRYHHYGGKGGHVDQEFLDEFATNIIASAPTGDGGAWSRVNIHLTSPSALYQSQRDRAFMFGAMILLAMVAAIFGLFAALDGL